ncbi:antirestriction protein [Escherichia coli]|nr:antirestriction protein [Escherichia coli]
MTFGEGTSSRDTLRDSTKHRVSELPVNWWVQPSVIWNLYTLNNGGAFMAPEPDDDDDETWVLFNAMNGNRAEMSPEAAGIAACLMTYSHHACRTECYAMTVHYYRLRDYALQHPECSAIMRIID